MAVRVIFRSPPERVSWLAQQLRDEGLSVEYVPPLETRSIDPYVVMTIFYIGDKVMDAAVGMSVDAIVHRVVDRVKERIAGTEGETMIEEGYDDDEPELAFSDHARHAYLACISPDPDSAAGDGECFLIFVTGEATTSHLEPIVLTWDYPDLPVVLATRALWRAGYDYEEEAVTKPWGAAWSLTARPR